MERAKKIIIATWIFATIYCSPWLGLLKTVCVDTPGYPTMERCGYRFDRQLYVYLYMADIVFFYVFPLIVAIGLYARIGLVLYRSTKTNLRRTANAHKKAERVRVSINGQMQKRNSSTVQQQDQARIQVSMKSQFVRL